MIFRQTLSFLMMILVGVALADAKPPPKSIFSVKMALKELAVIIDMDENIFKPNTRKSERSKKLRKKALKKYLLGKDASSWAYVLGYQDFLLGRKESFFLKIAVRSNKILPAYRAHAQKMLKQLTITKPSL